MSVKRESKQSKLAKKMGTGMVVLLIVLAAAGVWYASSHGLIPPSPLSFPGGNQQGAWCASAGQIVPLSQSTQNTGGTQPGCYNLPLSPDIHITDAYTGADLASWGCIIRDPSGAALESLTSSAAGVCNAANDYQTGTQLYVQICESGTSCTYSNANTVIYVPLPAPQGASGQGTGVMPFAAVSTQTTVALAQKVKQLDNNAAIFVRNVNGTTQADGATEDNDEVGVGNRPCYEFIISNTATSTTFPYGRGYTSSQQVEQGFRQLQAVATVRLASGTGSDMVAVTSGSVSKLLTKSSTEVFYSVTVPDASITKAFASDGTVSSIGTYSISICFDLSGITGSNTVTLQLELRQYFNIDYFVKTAVANTEAVTTFSTFDITFQN